MYNWTQTINRIGQYIQLKDMVIFVLLLDLYLNLRALFNKNNWYM